MTPGERRKAIDNAVALVAGNVAVPVAFRVALAALAEEMAELRLQLAELQRNQGRPGNGDCDR